MPQRVPPPPPAGPQARRAAPATPAPRAPAAGPRTRGRFAALAGALSLVLALQAWPGVAAPETAAPETGTDGAAAPETAAPEAAGGAPEPATVPQPPGQPSDDETLIELPIAPAATPRTDPDETDDSEGDSESGAAETDASEPDASELGAAGASEATVSDTGALQDMRLLFPADGILLDDAARTDLLGLAGYLNRHESQRVVLRAHAADGGQGTSQARRKSLSRALAVRTFLVDSGVAAERIFVRPLGSETTDGPPDRVDILPLRP